MQDTTPLYEKKGQFNGAVGAIVTLITGVGIAVLVLIFVGTLGGQTYQLTESKIEALTGSVVNESVTVLNSTAVSLAKDDLVQGSISVLNNSNTVALTKFSFDYDDGLVTLLDNNFNNTALDFSYTHGEATIQNHIKDGILSGFNALEQTGDYLPIIVLAVVISLVLFLVLGMTAFGGGGGGRGTAL